MNDHGARLRMAGLDAAFARGFCFTGKQMQKNAPLKQGRAKKW